MGRRRCSLLLWIRVLVVASIVSFYGLSAIVVGAESLNPSVGDSLEVRYHGEWQKCEVVELLADGRIIRAKLSNGRVVTRPLSRFRALPSEKSGAKGSSGIKPELRIWKDASGKYTVLARFIELAGDKVVLEKDDGPTIKVPFAKLSEVDQDYVSDRTADKSTNPASDPDDPFDTGEDTTANGTELWAGVKDIVLTAPGRNSYQPDLFADDVSTSNAVSTRLSPQSDFFEKITGVAADPAGSVAFVSRAVTFGAKKGFGAIDVVDLERGALLHSTTMAGPLSVEDAIHGKRPRVLSLMGADRDESHEATVWEALDGKLKEVATWSPYTANGRSEDSEIVFARFVDADHVITVDGEGLMAVWKIDGPKAIYRTNVGSSTPPIMSEGRKYVVVAHDLGLCVVEIKKAKIVLVLNVNASARAGMAFSPDGTRLATGAGFGKLNIWDLATGDKIGEHTCPMMHSGIEWVLDGHILLHNKYLYDLERRIPLWEYRGMRSVVTRLHGNRFLYTATSRSHDARGLFLVSLPHEEALRTAESLDAEELLVLKPGVAVALRMKTHLTPAEEDEAREALEAKLKENELDVVASSDLVLEAASHEGESREVTYRMWGSFRELTRNVAPVIYELKLFENGKNVWSRSGHGGPGFHFSLKENETLDDALRRLTKPSPEFFKRVEIPKLITRRPEGGMAYGASELAYGGLKVSRQRPRR